MGTTVSLAGVSYNIPSVGDGNYGEDVSAYLVALANNTKVFQVSSANFPLQQETNFGSNYGLKVAYVKSQATNPAGTGIFRLGNNEALGWRNAANSADLALKVNSSDVLEFNGTSISIGGAPVQTAITVSDTSTLDLSLSSNDISGSVKAGSIDDSHIATLAAIAYSKLALTGSIVNADISGSAAIALSKLATVTASKALVSDASGYVSASSVTTTELGYLSGVTSSVQTQLSNNATGISDHLADTVDAHDASAISVVPTGNLAADDVQEALVELQTDVDTRATTTALTNHTSASSGVHGVTGAVVGTTDTQSLSNKTITASDIDGGTASNTSRITLPKATKTTLDALTRKEGTVVYATDEDKVYYDDGTVLKPVGSGSGTINFITNPDGSAGTTGWTEGSFAAAARPSGTFTPSSGAGAFAISTTTTTPLGTGTTSFLLTKSAGASRQGRAVVSDFVLPLDYRAKVLKIDVNYIINSGTFVAGSNTTDSSLIWYAAFSTDNGSTYTLAEPSSFKLLSNSTTISDRFSGSIQTPYNATNMRLIAYVAETANSAWVVECITSVSPSQYVYGTPISDWQSYTTVVSGLGSGSTQTLQAQYMIVGPEIFVKIFSRKDSTAGTGSSTVTFSLPTGLQIDTSISQNGTLLNGSGGKGSGADSIFLPYQVSSTTIGLFQNDSSVLTGSEFGANQAVFINFSVPILGWSSSVQVADGYDGRVVAANVRNKNASPQSLLNTTWTKVTGFGAATIDTTNSWSSTNDEYTVISSGNYRTYVLINFEDSLAGIRNLRILVNGVEASASGGFFNDSTPTKAILNDILSLKAGDKITVEAWQNSGSTTDLQYEKYFSIEKLSGSPTISAQERVALRYTSTSGTSITNVATTIPYTNKVYDTHGAWNGTTFTAPISGNYRVTASYLVATSGGWVDNYINVVANGALVKANYRNITTPYSNEITDTVYLNAGQNMKIEGRLDSGTVNLNTTAIFNTLTIELVK